MGVPHLLDVTDTFSSEHTGSVLRPILLWLVPSLTANQFELIHHLIRKCAHFTEYFIFCLLLYRGVRGNRKGWRWTWGLAALFCAAGYSALDEIHQAFVASRTASPYDSLLDSTGAFAALVALWVWFRRRRSAGGAQNGDRRSSTGLTHQSGAINSPKNVKNKTARPGLPERAAKVCAETVLSSLLRPLLLLWLFFLFLEFELVTDELEMATLALSPTRLPAWMMRV